MSSEEMRSAAAAAVVEALTPALAQFDTALDGAVASQQTLAANLGAMLAGTPLAGSDGGRQ